MTPEHSDLLKKISRIPGSVSTKEAIYLYDSAKKCKNGVIVEVGSWYGRSTICLGLGSKFGHGVKVYAIDPHTGSPDQRTYKKINTLEAFRANIKNAELESVVEPIVTTSEEAAKNWTLPVELVFADANYYDYEETKKDFFRWSKFLTKNGIYAMHGTVPSVSGILEGIPLHGWEAPRKFLKDFIFCSKNFSAGGGYAFGIKNLKIHGTITSMERAEKITLLDKIKNRRAQLKSALLRVNHKLYLISALTPKPIKKWLKSLALNVF